MNLTPANILSVDIHCNLQVRALQTAVAQLVESAHAHLRQSTPATARLNRTADAIVLNTVWGFKEGARFSLPLGFCLGTPRLPLGAHKFSIRHGFSAVQSILYANVLVGDFRPVRRDMSTELAAGMYDIFRSRGAIGLVVDGLTRASELALSEGRSKLGQACLWGAAILSVASSALRFVTYAVSLAVAIGIGVVTAAFAGAAAGVIEALDSSTGPVVDFQDLTDMGSRAWSNAMAV